MTVNLLKLAVGAESVGSMRRYQAARLARDGVLTITTRQMPRRREEILDGGSLYWVVKGVVSVRQKILALDQSVDGDGRGFCTIGLAPDLVGTRPQPHRPFQGWRYLVPADAPDDLNHDGDGDLPEGLESELRRLGIF